MLRSSYSALFISCKTIVPIVPLIISNCIHALTLSLAPHATLRLSPESALDAAAPGRKLKSSISTARVADGRRAGFKKFAVLLINRYFLRKYLLLRISAARPVANPWQQGFCVVSCVAVPLIAHP